MRIAEQDLSDRDHPTCTSEAGLGRSSPNLSAQPERYHDRQIGKKRPGSRK
jgi:hypothetical protein